MAPSTDKPQSLTADYSSDTGQKQFKHDIGAVSEASSTKDRVEYLAKLRSSVTKLQDEVNVFLTKKMDEDKALDGKNKSLDDKKEEENYGEEVVEES